MAKLALAGRELDGGYVLVEQIGTESLGEVYLARGPDGGSVRIKVLSSRAAAARARFARELQAVRSLDHPGILALLGEGTLDDRPYMVFEHVEGDAVPEVLAARGGLPVDEAVTVARQVLEILAVAHGAGVVHRNLSPENVLLAEGRTVLRDFGLARVDAPIDGDSALTAANVRVGSLSYMAPEYIQSGDATAASDLFAVGVLLYQLLIGEPPPLVTYPAPPPSADRPEIPPHLDHAVRKLTAEHPADRPRDARAAMRLLDPPEASPPPAGLPRFALGAGLLVLVALGVAVWTLA